MRIITRLRSCVERKYVDRDWTIGENGEREECKIKEIRKRNKKKGKNEGNEGRDDGTRIFGSRLANEMHRILNAFRRSSDRPAGRW